MKYLKCIERSTVFFSVHKFHQIDSVTGNKPTLYSCVNSSVSNKEDLYVIFEFFSKLAIFLSLYFAQLYLRGVRSKQIRLL